MPKDCTEVANCSFLQHYDRRDNPLVNGYKRAFCNGPQARLCARMRMLDSGRTPPENLTPTGTLLSGQFWNDVITTKH